jgi:hypothetical protein
MSVPGKVTVTFVLSVLNIILQDLLTLFEAATTKSAEDFLCMVLSFRANIVTHGCYNTELFEGNVDWKNLSFTLEELSDSLMTYTLSYDLAQRSEATGQLRGMASELKNFGCTSTHEVFGQFFA